jgi:hypothetical protein
MNEERTGKCLRQVEHIRGNLWHRYLIAVNQVMMATVKLSKWWLQLICNIPAAPAYGVYISQLIRYSRACGSYQDFIDRGLLLTRKLLNQGFLLVKLKSSLRKLYYKTKDRVTRTPLKTEGELRCSERVISPCSNSGTRRVNLVTNPVISHEWGVLYVCFVDRCLSFCTFSFDHCVVCSSSIYGFWLSLWYLENHPPQVTDKLFRIMLYRHEQDSNIQH